MLNTIVLIIPVLLFVVFAEWYISYRRHDKTYSTGNFAMNLAIGAMDQVCSLIYFAALYFALEYVYSHFRLFTISERWYNWIIAYIVVDFLSYWYHRFSHRVNILWAGHVTHHSSEHYNFSNGFRTSFFQGINRILFWCCLPLFGFSPLMLVVILKVSGLYDFILHTQYIPKLGFLEKILITPSQHRVHHGRNDIYIDKNYGSTFVIWDKIFGTFQEETEEVEYGIKGSYVDNNPFMAVGYYYHYLWQAMKLKQRFHEKIWLLFIPPERTPKPGVQARSRTRQQASPLPLPFFKYAWAQIAWAAAGLIVMLLFKDFLAAWEIILYSLLGIIIISASAMMLNGRFYGDLIREETAKLLFILTAIIIAFNFNPRFYVAVIAIFPVASLISLLAIRDRDKTVTG